MFINSGHSPRNINVQSPKLPIYSLNVPKQQSIYNLPPFIISSAIYFANSLNQALTFFPCSVSSLLPSSKL